ncbi:DUF4089 domain-containing protein [Lichenicoccus sp.]|uniref:DUF4089 domain-containing protein n=1 Tax=Lichenicoccus sp. TaxID=2781899 RepID=UPI003D0E5D9D
MDEPDFHALVRANAAFLALPIDPAMLDGVVANLVLLHRHAAAVMEFALPDALDAAPSFRP